MMHEQKPTITAIQAATGRDRKTIRKVVTEQKHGHDLTRRTRESQRDPYKEYIEERWNQGFQRFNPQYLNKSSDRMGLLTITMRWY